MELNFLGGAGEVGRSCIMLRTDRSSILVDCGLKKGPQTKYPNLEDLELVDGILVTHAHIDHAGGLPLFAKRGLLGKGAKVYCTPPTASLLRILLNDSYKLQRAEWRRKGENHLYKKKHIDEVLGRLRIVSYQKFKIAADIEAEFGYAGHILGSAWARVEAGGRSFLFTGDLGEGRSTHLNPPAVPLNSDILVTESTYGGTNHHPSFSKECKKFVELASIDAPVLIPTFAIDRSIIILHLLRRSELIDDRRVWYDGMIDRAIPIYRAFASDIYMSSSIMNLIKHSGDPHPFLPEGTRKPSTMKERKKIVEKDDPIIVAPPGMLQGGLSLFYLKKLAEIKGQFRVILTGYQAPGTVGHKLTEAKNKGVDVTLRGFINSEGIQEDAEIGVYRKQVTVPSEWVHALRGFSSHSSASHLFNFARKVMPREIYIIHGNGENSQAFARFLRNDSTLQNCRIELPEIGSTYEIEEAPSVSLGSKIENLEKRISELERKVAGK